MHRIENKNIAPQGDDLPLLTVLKLLMTQNQAVLIRAHYKPDLWNSFVKDSLGNGDHRT